MRVKLRDDAEVSANFKPRLARLALAAVGVPFAYGGIEEGARHALPSGGFDSILPLIDARGLSLFRKKMPEDTWGALAGGAVLASNTTSNTTSNTDTQSDRRIEYDTVTDVGGQVTHTPDHETMSVGDDTKTDTASDTKTGDWY